MTTDHQKFQNCMLWKQSIELLSLWLFLLQKLQSVALSLGRKMDLHFESMSFWLFMWLTVQRLKIFFSWKDARKHICPVMYALPSAWFLERLCGQVAEVLRKQFLIFQWQWFEKTSSLWSTIVKKRQCIFYLPVLRNFSIFGIHLSIETYASFCVESINVFITSDHQTSEDMSSQYAERLWEDYIIDFHNSD